jgi:hypothetical protein
MVRSTLALAVLLSVASLSRADLITPAAWVGNNSAASCKLVNTTSALMVTQIQVIGSAGNVVEDSGGIALSSGQVYALYDFFPSDFVYCRFVNANAHKVRADLTVMSTTSLNGDETDTAVVAAQ